MKQHNKWPYRVYAGLRNTLPQEPHFARLGSGSTSCTGVGTDCGSLTACAGTSSSGGCSF